MGGDAADDFFEYDRHLLDFGLLHLADQTAGEFPSFPYDQLVCFSDRGRRRRLDPDQMLRFENQLRLAAFENDRVGRVEIVEQILPVIPRGAEQNRRVEFPPPVDAHV